jgi:hypothetical protein
MDELGKLYEGAKAEGDSEEEIRDFLKWAVNKKHGFLRLVWSDGTVTEKKMEC